MLGKREIRRDLQQKREMDRYGMQSVAFLVFLSFSMFYFLNSSNRGVAVGVSSTSSISSKPTSTVGRSSSSVSSHQVSSTGVERQRLATLSSGAPLRRRLLQSSNPYIGYGALTGNNVPCPPQSGRSYYTSNCQSATGPVNPYSRGCSTIARCARSS